MAHTYSKRDWLFGFLREAFVEEELKAFSGANLSALLAFSRFSSMAILLFNGRRRSFYALLSSRLKMPTKWFHPDKSIRGDKNAIGKEMEMERKLR